MKLADVIRNADKIVIDDSFVNRVEVVYSCKLPKFVKYILCIPENESFDEPVILHKLSNDMILEATEEMNSDFISNHVLPLFDCSDNDYLCYDYSSQIWCMYNIVNDRAFDKHENILALI
jgi:hypothetical protein